MIAEYAARPKPGPVLTCKICGDETVEGYNLALAALLCKQLGEGGLRVLEWYRLLGFWACRCLGFGLVWV